MYRFESSGPSPGLASSLDLRFYYCGTIECDQSHGHGPALHDHYRLHFINSGRGRLTIAGQTWDLSAGDCFLLVPDQLSSYQPVANESWHYYWVAFNGLNAQSYLRRAGFSSDRPAWAVPDIGAFLSRFERMFAASTQQSTGDLLLTAELYGLLANLVDAAPEQPVAFDGKGQKTLYIAKAIEWLELNYPRAISIAELVAHIGLNGKYFSRIFKEETGMSPQSFLINLRLNKACALLGDQRLRVGDIARSVGYPDQLLFSRMFKRIKGKSPTSFLDHGN